MEKVIYEDEHTKLIAEATGDIVRIRQYDEGHSTGEVAMYYHELFELVDFIKNVERIEIEE